MLISTASVQLVNPLEWLVSNWPTLIGILGAVGLLATFVWLALQPDDEAGAGEVPRTAESRSEAKPESVDES